MTNAPQADDDRNYTQLLTLLTVSAAMVGVCLTAIGLVSVVEVLSKWESFVDDILAIDSLLFSFVTLFSFLGIRTRIRRMLPRYVAVLDVLFCIGILGMVTASLMLAWAII